jgi:hypothetical protein
MYLPAEATPESIAAQRNPFFRAQSDVAASLPICAGTRREVHIDRWRCKSTPACWAARHHCSAQYALPRPSIDWLTFGSTGNELQYQSRNMPLGTSAKLLVSEAEACELLSLSSNDLLWLTATEQLTPFFIRGRKLYEVQRLH